MNSETEYTGTATYCPEDNKLRLYVGRVPREEYLKLKADGWTSTPKQRENGGCDFVATWTPSRRDTALAYAGIIEDEDQSPEERSADRAERFADYREKRTSEATGHADRYDAGPHIHGFQNLARAERSARRHDRIAGRAVDAWGKAEYWQRRTAGVISHALYKSLPGVRMGRIKELEASIRKSEKNREEYTERRQMWLDCAAMTDTAEQNNRASLIAGASSSYYDYKHPRPELVKNSNIRDNGSSLWTLLTMNNGEYGEPITGAEACALYLKYNGPIAEEGSWLQHYRLRLAYENQMLEAAGGRAGDIEMVVGGWLLGGRHMTKEERRIVKVNKSPVTDRVVSVLVRDNRPSSRNHYGNPFPDGISMILSHTVKIERLSPDLYRAPTPEELAEFIASEKAAKAKAPKKEVCPLINPTDADAEKLQALLNGVERSRFATPQMPIKMTFAEYTGRGTTTIICENGTEHRSRYGSNLTRFDVFKVRTIYGDNYSARRVVVLSDKSQKGIPWEAVTEAKAQTPSAEKMQTRLPELFALVADLSGSYRQRTKDEQQFLSDAEYLGWVSLECSTPRMTEAGATMRKQLAEAQTVNA